MNFRLLLGDVNIPEEQRGSHIFLKHPDGRSTVVPVHKTEDLGRGLLRKIIHDADMTKEEFLELLRDI